MPLMDQPRSLTTKYSLRSFVGIFIKRCKLPLQIRNGEKTQREPRQHGCRAHYNVKHWSNRGLQLLSCQQQSYCSCQDKPVALIYFGQVKLTKPLIIT
jgi:hypothetical protein